MEHTIEFKFAKSAEEMVEEMKPQIQAVLDKTKADLKANLETIVNRELSRRTWCPVSSQDLPPSKNDPWRQVFQDFQSYACLSITGAQAVEGAPSFYRLCWDEHPPKPESAGGVTVLQFQQGPASEGINGITDEMLLSVLFDRQSRHLKAHSDCQDTAAAKAHIRGAIQALRKRDGREPALL